HSLDELAKDMEQMRKGKDIYVTGVTNVGKSTFLNAFIQRSTGIKEAITTSYFPGTTLGFITIPLDDDAALIDTPGIMKDRKSTRLNSSHVSISYAVFCLKKKK